VVPIPLNIKNIKAVVFDLDNTLVSSKINFQGLREQLNCPMHQDILTHADSFLEAADRERAHKLILDHELSDAQNSVSLSGCHSLLHYLKDNHFHTGIVTRNCAEASKCKLDHCNITVEEVISREQYAPKPSPEALTALADLWQLQPHQVLYVGDYLYDLEAANNANMPSCLITHGEVKPFESLASLSVNQLDDLLSYIQRYG